MKNLGVLVAAFAMPIAAIAAAGFGSSEEVRSAHPEFFAPGCVCVVTNEAVAYYVYNGRAVRLFRDIPVEANPDLRTMARLRAERNLLQKIAPHGECRSIELNGSVQIAKAIEDNIVTYVFAVPVANVKIVDCAQGDVTLFNGAKESNVASTSEEAASSDAMLQLLDAAEQNPLDGVLQARIAEAYFKVQMQDDATSAALKAKELFLSEIGSGMPEGDVDAFLSALGILAKCGRIDEAKSGYQAAMKLDRLEHRQKAMHELNRLKKSR